MQQSLHTRERPGFMTLPPIAILIAEDDEIVRRQMARLLRVEGCRVYEASRGDQAAHIVDTEDIDLVLTDWKMPGMDGVGVLNHVRLNHPDIPVALVTAYPEALEQFKPDGILAKPFNAEQLRQLIHRLTQKQKT